MVLLTNGPPLGGLGGGSTGPRHSPDAELARARSKNSKGRTGRRQLRFISRTQAQRQHLDKGLPVATEGWRERWRSHRSRIDGTKIVRACRYRYEKDENKNQSR
jgi:hypothetical protein